MPDALERHLTELADDLHVPVPDGLDAAVMARVGASAPPRRRWRRWVAGLLLGLLGGGVVVSPVGATLREWLGFHGVAVTSGDPETGTPVVPTATGGADLEEAAAEVGFTPVVPAELGPPEGVEVSDEVVLSLSWSTDSGTVRLDQFRGSVEPLFWKTADGAQRVTVSGTDALWLPTAHRVVVVSDDGTVRSLPSRLAAPTLVWLDGDLTLRLEGDLTLEEATEIAESGD